MAIPALPGAVDSAYMVSSKILTGPLGAVWKQERCGLFTGRLREGSWADGNLREVHLRAGTTLRTSREAAYRIYLLAIAETYCNIGRCRPKFTVLVRIIARRWEL